jgi:hypothetical protein
VEKKGVRSTYDGQTSPPSQAREPGFIQHLKGEERERVVTERVGMRIGIGMGEPTISARSTRKFVLVQREG